MLTKQKIRSIPKDGLEGLKENFTKDALSGFLVFLLALPLSLGIAKASQFPMIFGLVTAIVGGIVVSLLGGSRLSIKGPAAGLIVIVSGSVTELGDGETGWHLALGAIVIAGLIQVLFGVLKLGKLADFFPSAAIHGMLAAIGIIIMAKQLHLILGINPATLKGMNPIRLIAALPHSIMHENAHLAEIGLACLLIMIVMSYISHEKIKKIPAPLVVLAVAIPLGLALHIKSDGAIANYALVKVGHLSDAFSNGLVNVDFSGMWNHTGIFVKYVILYAMIGSIESLLTAKAIDGMDPFKRKTDYNRDLIGIGVGNTLCGILGALPMISEVARSSANVSYGARTAWANFFHGLFLLLALLIGVAFIEMIPSVALAAMLVFVGFRLAHPRVFAHTLHIGKEQLFIFCVTILVTISTDLLMGVASGIILELVINLIHGARLRTLFRNKISVDENGGHYIVKPESDLLFSNVLGFKKAFNTVPAGKDITVDLSSARVVDHTSLITLNDMAEHYRETGGKVLVTGMNNHTPVAKSATSTRKQKYA